jgi:hypothetical protein
MTVADGAVVASREPETEVEVAGGIGFQDGQVRVPELEGSP